MSFLLAVVKFYLPDFAIGSITPVPFYTQDILLTGATSSSTTSPLITYYECKSKDSKGRECMAVLQCPREVVSNAVLFPQSMSTRQRQTSG